MKKFIVSFVLIFILAFQSFTVGVFASDIDIIPVEEVQSENISKNIGGGEVQPMGVKIKFAREALLLISSQLKNISTSVLNSKLISWFTSATTRKVVLDYSYTIANELEYTAIRMNAFTQYSYQILRDLISQALARAGGPTRYADDIAKFIEYFFL